MVLIIKYSSPLNKTTLLKLTIYLDTLLLDKIRHSNNFIFNSYKSTTKKNTKTKDGGGRTNGVHIINRRNSHSRDKFKLRRPQNTDVAFSRQKSR